MKVYLLPDHTKARKIHFQILKTDVYQFEQNSSEYFIDKTINLNWQDYQSILTKLSIFIDKLSIFTDKTNNLHCKDYQSLLTKLSFLLTALSILINSNLYCQAGKRKTRVRKHSLSPVFDEMLRVIPKNLVALSINWHTEVCDASGNNTAEDDVGVSMAQVHILGIGKLMKNN